MKIDYSPYSLNPCAPIGSVASGRPRQGALLRIQFKDGSIGYSDCHPWIELGDLSIEAQLQRLRERKLTLQAKRSLEYAELDAQARNENRSLFSELDLPPSHLLLTDFSELNRKKLEGWAKQGFTRIKVKFGSRLVPGAELLAELATELKQHSLKIRLDFNSTLTFNQFEEFLDHLGPAHEHLDFVEDPFPYNSHLWSQIQKRWGIRLALDRISQFEMTDLTAESFSVWILKPAIQNPKGIAQFARTWKKPIVVTSYLDHPLGQLCAAWTGAQLANDATLNIETCGFLSHHAYEANAFSEQLLSRGPHLMPPPGSGFGMSTLLEDQKWISL